MTREQEEQSRVAFKQWWHEQKEHCLDGTRYYALIERAWQARGDYEATRPTPAQPDRAVYAEPYKQDLYAEPYAKPDRAEVSVLRVIEENGQDYAVLHVEELTRLQRLAHPLTPAEREEAVRVMALAIEEGCGHAGGLINRHVAACAALSALEAKGYVGRKTPEFDPDRPHFTTAPDVLKERCEAVVCILKENEE